MERINWDVVVPMTYGLVCLIVVLVHGPIGLVAIIGAVLLAIYYAGVRRAVPRPAGGRVRDRQRNR